jgi:phosphate starvation-inducible PhoH-like protein
MAKTNGRRNGGNGSPINGTIELLPNDLKNIYVNKTIGKKVVIKCKNEYQKDFIRIIDENEITLCSGMAGAGKSYLSLLKALDYIQKPDNGYRNLFIMTPAVELEEKLGAMPGTLLEKLHPYLFSSYYLIDKIIGKEGREKMVSEQIIQPMALSFLTGVNIDNGILIFEEAQNSSVKQMKRLLTRIGYNAKLIISGDLQQIDRFKNEDECGLKYAMERLTNVKGVGIYDFPPDSSVRNPIINRIIEKYD